jgi:aspartyl/asparaginyl-tRNA synthetase
MGFTVEPSVISKNTLNAVILFDYPANIKFYMRLNDNTEPGNCSCYGYPFPGIGEIVGGSKESVLYVVEK